jgi:hypothetical protein
LRGNESEDEYEARHMERGYDGRGQVRDPEHDRRLKQNRDRDEGEEEGSSRRSSRRGRDRDQEREEEESTQSRRRR